MKAQIDQIRTLLTEIEASCEPPPHQTAGPTWSGFELPDIILEIVDDLQPLLSPYEAAFYWHAFAHSIAETGAPYIRLSTRPLRRGIVKSSRADAVAEGKVRDVLRSLETVGAIRKENTGREGTLYRVMIPDEIEACRKLRAERAAAEKEEQESAADPSTDDFYSVRANRAKVYERDDYKCRYCGKQLTRFTATLDHIQAVSAGGDNSMHNLVTACLDCNSRKHGRPLGDFLADNQSPRP